MDRQAEGLLRKLPAPQACLFSYLSFAWFKRNFTAADDTKLAVTRHRMA